MAKKISGLHRQDVLFKYQYFVDEAQVEGQAKTVFITGQMNDWDLEEMVLDPTNSKRYTYETLVKGGQIYNFYLFIDGQMVIDPNQKKTPNGKANWIFVPFGDNNV